MCCGWFCAYGGSLIGRGRRGRAWASAMLAPAGLLAIQLFEVQRDRPGDLCRRRGGTGHNRIRGLPCSGAAAMRVDPIIALRSE